MKICIILMHDNADTIQRNFNRAFEMIENTELFFVYYNKPNLIKYITSHNIDAIIISGSRHRITKKDSPTLPKRILHLGIPILALCYGFEWIVQTLGGKVATFKNDDERMYNKVFKINEPFEVSERKYAFRHHEYIEALPSNGWEPIKTYRNQIWIAYNKQLNILGLQFHPEVYVNSAREFYNNWINWIK